ncbi:MAG: flagellar biosynthesis anti-sigma factor FlgM [Edaphobacter sp.]
MSYSNGINNLQQTISPIATTESKPVVPANAPGTTANASREPASGAGRTDEANLSSAGSFVSQALGGSDVRPEKVAALQQAIATGSYNVSSSDVADKIIQSLLG